MTSMVSWDDVEAELWKAGIKNVQVLDRLRATITRFAYDLGRQMYEVEETPDPYGEGMSPGEWDPDSKRACCSQCGDVKSFSQFGLDMHHPSGHKLTCRRCAGIPPEVDLTAKYHCRSCGQRKELMQFPKAKIISPARNINCLECQGDRVVAEYKYLCPGCGARKELEEFPLEKRRNSRIRSLCSACKR